MPLPDEYSRVAKELDEELETALQRGIEELRKEGFQATADALRTLRDYAMRSHEVIVNRIREYGIVTMEEEQRKQLMGMVASAMVEKAITDTKFRQQEREQAFWTTTQAKVGAVVGLLTLVTIAITLVYDTFFGIAHPIPLP